MTDNVIKITQGDYAVLVLTAKNTDLTGATLTTYMHGPNGVVVTFPNSQHTIDPDQDENIGKFTLTLSVTDTASLSAGPNKDIITKVALSGNPIYYQGFNVLTVYPNVPAK